MKSNRRGFTLIELLLGIVIFSIAALTIYATFSAGIAISHRSEKGGEVYREIKMAFNLMTTELENMVPYNFSESYPEQKSFTGAEDKITFILPTAKGLKVVSYSLMDPEESSVTKTLMGQRHSKNVSVTNSEEINRVKYLVREETDFIDYLQGGNETETEILATHVEEDSLKFSYAYLEDEKSENIVWKSEWDSDYVPLGVRVEINFLPSGGQSIPLTKNILIPTGYFGVIESQS